PALHSARLEERTGVLDAESDRRGSGGESDHRRGDRARRRRAVTELAVVVAAPAHDVARLEDRARVRRARGDRLDRGCEALDLDGRGDRAWSGVSELPAVVPAPTHDAAGVRQRAGVIAPRGDRGRAGAEPGDIRRRRLVGGLGPRSSLTLVRLAPALHRAL